MAIQTAAGKRYKGVLGAFKTRIHKNRLGELLVLGGKITPIELRYALQVARHERRPLGRVLIEQNIVAAGAIRRALAEQMAVRFMTAVMTLFISFAGMGMAKSASAAGGIKDVPARVAFNDAVFTPVAAYPKLFGSTEKRSGSLNAFTKWTGMFAKFDSALDTQSGARDITQFKIALNDLRGLPLATMVEQVNTMMNKVRYIEDSANYGKSDYWATPMEFMARGGDCEDFAIAKYTALRILGVPEERMRVAIVQDLQKDIPHAVLIVYTDHGPVILDNQNKTVLHADRVKHYKPIFSINRDAWWLHTRPDNGVTVVASASK